MLSSFLIGLVGGQRAMTPLATISVAAASGRLPPGNGAPHILAHPVVAAATLILAAAELAGDKMKSAPDRTVPIGLAARFTTSAIAGAALSPRRQRWRGAAIGGSVAVLASYPGWHARMATMPRYGQMRSGLVEDTLVVTAAIAILRASSRRRQPKAVSRSPIATRNGANPSMLTSTTSPGRTGPTPAGVPV